ncbi:MAG: GMC family oxidoreductase, partial [Acidimicrobiia bacterium]|nr:GMC family oxidoreductase [Acidimicrobiia bacterium]
TSIHRDGKRVRMVHPSAHHHAGTTRMSVRPEDGVVDPRGAVHGVDNLFVAGASVFPTAGYANPTLTAMALGCRVGHHVLT